MTARSGILAWLGFSVALCGQTASAQSWGSEGFVLFTMDSTWVDGYGGMVNNAGQVAVTATFGVPKGGIFSPVDPAIWFAREVDGVSDWTFARGINNSGTVVNYRPQYIATLNDGSGHSRIDVRMAPLGLNDAGQVVGQLGPGPDGVVWDPVNGMRLIPKGDFTGTITPFDISANGIIAGVARDDQTQRAFIQTGTNDPVYFAPNSLAYSVNSLGFAVGYQFDPWLGFNRAFVFSFDGVHALGGDGESYAYDISENNLVVGSVGGRAAIWEAGTQIFLDAIVGDGWTFTEATSVSDNGQWIVARGYNSITGYQGEVLLGQAPAAVAPEPATLALLAGGLAGLGAVRRRRKR